MRHVGLAERRARLAHQHRLLPHRRTDDVVAIANDLVALHSSDPATVFLSVFARMRDPAADVLDSALYEQHTLLRFHAMRRTLWVASPELMEAMYASSTRKIAANERRQLLKFLSATADVEDPVSLLQRLEEELLGYLREVGSSSTREIGVQRPALARKIMIGSGEHTVEVGAHTRVASLAGFDGTLIRGRPGGSWVGSEYRWHHLDDWSGADVDRFDERSGCAMVLRAYLDRYGPVTEVDAKWWTGWTASTVRQALADIEAQEVSLDSGSGWILPDDPLLDMSAEPEDQPWVVLLPGLDPSTMGWKERDWFLSDAVASRVFDRNGNAGPTIWSDGEVIGGWVQQSSGSIGVELLKSLTAAESSLLTVECERLREAIGDVRFRVRFPSPNQKDLR